MYALREAVQGMVRTRYMTLISILTITVALFLFSIVGIITMGANNLVNKIQKSEKLNVYLKDEMSDGDMLALDETIVSMNEVESTRIVSKEDAVKEFEKIFGSDLLLALEKNPLPRSIVVTMSKGHRTSSDYEKLTERIRASDGVESVEFGSEWVSKLDIFFIIFVIVEGILIALAVTACILVISNTITMTLIARKEAIEIMRLVGATDSFIREPFYIEGMIQGLISGIVAFIIFYGIYLWLQFAVPEIDVFMYMFRIKEMQNLSYPLILGLIIPVGGFLGLLGSYVAVRRAL